MALTDVGVRNAKSGTKSRKLYDAEGLYLLIHPQGGKWWRLRYRFDGHEKGLSLGTYPETGLKEARAKRDAARMQLARGINPSDVRKAEKVAKADTLAAVTREWCVMLKRSCDRRLERDILPWLGAKPVGEITAPELLTALRRIESRGTGETAHRALRTCGQVFSYAIITGRAVRNPAADLKGALSPVRGGHYPALTNPQAVGALLRALDGYEGGFITRSALRLIPLVFTRPGELRAAEWSEFDLDAAEWNIHPSRMKTGRPHLVPLATQALAILTELHPLTGSGRYVFPGVRTPTRPMSENTVNAALRRLGYEKTEMTGHGFRAMARTILDEILGFPPHLIEHQLAHIVCDPLGRSYNRTQHLPQRREMLQKWADFLDSLRDGNVIAMNRGTRPTP